MRLSKQGRNVEWLNHCGKYSRGVESVRAIETERQSERIYEVHQSSIILG